MRTSSELTENVVYNGEHSMTEYGKVPKFMGQEKSNVFWTNCVYEKKRWREITSGGASEGEMCDIMNK